MSSDAQGSRQCSYLFPLRTFTSKFQTNVRHMIASGGKRLH